MKNDNDSSEKTSRRQFTKGVLTTAVVLPVVASISCQTAPCPPPPPPPTELNPPTGPTMGKCFPSGGGTLEHIPPMGFDGGGGSLLIETTTPLVKNGAVYQDVPAIPDDKIGDILEVRVVTEMAKRPYVDDVRYYLLPPDCKLRFWYQYLLASPGPNDCQYQPIPNFDVKTHDVEIIGGKKSASPPRTLSMSFPEDLKAKEKTYKCKHPHRYRQADKTGNSGHFRVGQWRIVDINGNVVKDNVTGKPFEDNVNNATTIPEHFRFYVTFDHYEPHP